MRHRALPSDFDFPTEVGHLRLRNPVIASSGTYGYGMEYARYGDPSRLGAVVVKSLTVEPRPGFAAPRVTMLAEPGSMRNAIGVPNPGVRRWAESILPDMMDANVAVVASIWGVDAERVIEAARILAAYPGPIAWEVNLSCPNTEHPGSPVAHEADAASAVCRAVRELAPDNVAIWAKLAPDAEHVVDVGVACFVAGADAVTVSNTYRADAMNPTLPQLGGGPGGMSGSVLRQYVRPIVEKFGASHSDVSVIACGGVLSSEIAMDYIGLGAKAVQIGTASLFDPRACHKIARGVVARLRAAS